MATDCPTPEEIESSLDGAPAESGREPVEAHLEECPPCGARARTVESLDALLMDGLLRRDPRAGRVSARLASRLVAIGEREAQKRAALRATTPATAGSTPAGTRTSGRRAVVLPLAARGGRGRRAGAFGGPLSWAAAAACIAAASTAVWLSWPDRTSGGAGASLAARGGAGSKDAALDRSTEESARRADTRLASAGSARAGGGAIAGPSTLRPGTDAPASEDASGPFGARESGEDGDERISGPDGARPLPAATGDPTTLPGEDAPLAPEERGPALAGPLLAPEPGAKGGNGKDKQGGVVSASPLKKGPVTRLAIGFESPLAAFDGAVIPGGKGENGRLLEAKEAKGDALAGVRAAVRRSALFEARPGTTIELSYRLYGPAPLALVAANETQGKLFGFTIEKPAVGRWTRVTIALADLRRIGDSDQAPRPGDVFGSIELLAGRPGETVRLLLDDVHVVDKAP